MDHGIVIVALIFGILLSAVYTNTSHAQISKQLPPNTQLSSPKSHAVKITSPTKDEHVPIGKDLMVLGTSLDNPTSNCQVSIIVNAIKPYRQATATGPSGATDYSTWNFFLTSKYTTIKEGPNKITAKYTCSDNPSLRSFYNVNVTGVEIATATAVTTTAAG
jgi:hypothetical protein